MIYISFESQYATSY